MGLHYSIKDYRYIIVNDAYERFSGIKREHFIGRNVSEYLGEDVFNQFVKPHFDKCLQGDTVIYQEWFEYPSMGRRFVEVTYSPYRDVRNNISGVLSNTRDITERKMAEDALQRVRFSIENLSEGVFWVGETGCFTDVNAAACRKLGYTREELLTMSVADIDPCFPAEQWAPHWEEMKQCGMKVFETVHRAKNGNLIPMELVVHNQFFGNQRYNCVLGRDITEQKKAKEALQESEEKFRNLVETISDVIFEVDAQGTATYVSPSGLKIWGGAMSDVVGKNFIELVHPDDREQLVNRFVELQQGIKKPMIYRFVDRSGRILWGRSHSTPIWKNGRFAGARGTLMDITAQKEAEAEKEKLQQKLLQAQKMESVGRLAGGVAHDFNNMLSVILGYTEMALEQVEPGQPLHAGLLEIQKAARHSADTTRQLLAFARKQTIAPRVLDLKRNGRRDAQDVAAAHR